MLAAYADPPYLGCCSRYGHRHEEPWGCWDNLGTHARLVQHLEERFDTWAMSASAPSLRKILPVCPPRARVAAWVKPFASFKPNVNPGYTWEPVIFVPGRPRQRYEPTVRDYIAENITLQKGLVGAKPPAVCAWILDLMNLDPAVDQLVDLFPGSGAMTDAWRDRTAGS